MTFRLALICGSTLVLAACGSGSPNNDAVRGSDGSRDRIMKRACLDSGAFTMAQDKTRICDCMVREINSAGIDTAYILEHWQSQKNRTFGKSILPSSMQSIKERCGGYG